MTEQMLLQQWKHLPENMKQELLVFFEYLKFKYKIQDSKTSKLTEGKPEKNKRNGKKPLKAGFLKGTFILSEDFNAPLEDFKEYM